MPVSIEVCQDADELALTAAEAFIHIAQESITTRGRFRMCLAGGSTPEKTYSLLAMPERSSKLDWSRIDFFFGDERLVPHDDSRSNYALAERTLFSKAPVIPGQIYGVDTIGVSADAAANAYENTLKRAFDLPTGSQPPRFDLIFLGMGDDGHTASLFPGMPSLHVQDRWVLGSPAGTLPPPVDRITLTFPVLNAGRNVLFLVSGSKKADALHDLLSGKSSIDQHPSAGVKPVDGRLTWLVDKAAMRLV